jgi:iron(II)-dependent oxidoreductase
MAIDALTTAELAGEPEQMLLALQDARARTLALVAHLDDEQLERVYSPLMSPLVWDLGHIAAYEDLWIANRHGEMALLRPDLADLYDAFETPRAVRGEIEALGPEQAREYLAAVRARTIETIATRGVGDGVVCEMVVRHELQHGETMRQTLAIAGLLPADEQSRRDHVLAPLDAADQWIEIPAGPFEMGAAAEGFAYDNERPRQLLQTPAYRIARHPVSNASWMRFSDEGGYERRELWSEQGWAWRKQEDASPDPAIAAADARAAVCHVSWFEADAFARASGARLPSEAEWEKAATRHEQAPAETVGGRAPARALEAVGQVWEWTATSFNGYPGFVAYPYREYSEVFFGKDYRVLKGGSWATDARVTNARFRNWDLPQRRQIFAGLRLASDPA